MKGKDSISEIKELVDKDINTKNNSDEIALMYTSARGILKL